MSRRAFHRFFFAVAFTALLFAPICLKAISSIGVDFPSWTGVGQERSYLEGRAYQNLPEVSVEALTSSEFQDDLEQYVSDLLPFKDEAMLINARLQRAGIEIANIPFGFDVYPTYFDSDHVYDPETDMVVKVMDLASQELAAEHESAADAYNELAAAHGDIDWYFYRVERVNSSDGNPTAELLSGPVVGTEWLSQNFFDQLDGRIRVIDGLLADDGSLPEGYFRTDHHWSVEGAWAAYEEAVGAMGIPPASKDDVEVLAWDDVEFFGSLARSGLCLAPQGDVLTDYWVDIPGLKVTLDGKEGSLASLDHRAMYEEGDWNRNAYVNRYAEYFHGDFGFMTLVNEELEGGSLLIVGDSFTNNMERFFSLNFRNVNVLDPRYSDMTVAEVIERYGVESVLFVLGSTTLASADTVDALTP